jgi:hypothetical protein
MKHGVLVSLGAHGEVEAWCPRLPIAPLPSLSGQVSGQASHDQQTSFCVLVSPTLTPAPSPNIKPHESQSGT